MFLLGWKFYTSFNDDAFIFFYLDRYISDS
jgi:hypothetical protein